MTTRLEHLRRFYDLMAALEVRSGGPFRLSECDGRMTLPKRGVYFFTEPGEARSGSGAGPRIVRVGTHALKAGSRTTLWGRLSQHRGVVKSGGGNHRGSIFRLIVGTALMRRDGLSCAGVGNTAKEGVRESELAWERTVSETIRNMPFVCLAVEDEADPHSLRGYIERNSIALLSGLGDGQCDQPSATWLGHHSDRARVRESGLWNQNHVNEHYDAAFLDRLQDLIGTTGRIA